MSRHPSLWSRWLSSNNRPLCRRPPPDDVRPILEALEERWLLTSYVVNTTLDLLHDTVPGQVTLRDVLSAISSQSASGQAAAGTVINTVKFAIPGGGPQTISVGSGGYGALPSITRQV